MPPLPAEAEELGRNASRAGRRGGVVTTPRRAWQRLLRRYGVYGLAWALVLTLSWLTYRRGLVLGGTAAWAGLLHPVLFALAGWPVLRSFVRGRRWLTIPNAVLGLTYVALGLGSVHFVFRFRSIFYPALRRPEEVRAALLVVVIGIVAYRMGVAASRTFGPARRIPRLPATPPWSRGVRTGAFGAIGFAVCVTLYLAASGSLGYRTGAGGIAGTGLWSMLSYLSWMGLVALAGVYHYWFSGTPFPRKDRFFVVAATTILAGLGLLSGMKAEFLVVFFGVAVPAMWARPATWTRGRGSRGKEVAIGAGLLAVLFLVFALNPMYRVALQRLQSTESRLQQGVEAMPLVLHQLGASEDSGFSLLTSGAERAWARLSVFPYLLAVLDQVPERYAFRRFERYLQLPAMSVVPRVLWPGKPANASATDFQQQFISTTVVFSTTPTVYGWAYWEMGLAGVVIIMLTLGFAAGLVEGYLAERQRREVAAVLLYTALFVTLSTIESDPFWLLGGLPKMIIVAAAVYALFVMPARLRGRPVAGSAQRARQRAHE